MDEAAYEGVGRLQMRGRRALKGGERAAGSSRRERRQSPALGLLHW